MYLCLIVSQSHELSAIETSATHLRKTRLSVEVSKLHILWFQFMQKRGNSEAKAIFEKCVPAFFYKPQQKDCLWVTLHSLHQHSRSVITQREKRRSEVTLDGGGGGGADARVQQIETMFTSYILFFSVLKDQWIRAKYERREFTGESNKFLQIYTSGDCFIIFILCTDKMYFQLWPG